MFKSFCNIFGLSTCILSHKQHRNIKVTIISLYFANYFNWSKWLKKINRRVFSYKYHIILPVFFSSEYCKQFDALALVSQGVNNACLPGSDLEGSLKDSLLLFDNHNCKNILLQSKMVSQCIFCEGGGGAPPLPKIYDFLYLFQTWPLNSPPLLASVHYFIYS